MLVALKVIHTRILYGQMFKIPFRATLKSLCFALNTSLD